MSFYRQKDFLLLKWEKEKTPEAELGGFEGLQMQPAETS